MALMITGAVVFAVGAFFGADHAQQYRDILVNELKNG